MSDPADELADAAQAFALAILRAAQAPPVLISIEEAMRRLGVSRGTIYRLIESGELVDRRIGRRRLIVAASVDRLAGPE
jgi:excisionase family DNA binding protein